MLVAIVARFSFDRLEMGRIALYDNEAPSPRRSYASRLLLLLVAVSVAAALLYADLPDVLLPVILDSQVSAKPFCPKQPEPLVPSRAFKVDDGYRSKVAEHLAAAVRVPTVNYDGMGDVETDVSTLGCQSSMTEPCFMQVSLAALLGSPQAS